MEAERAQIDVFAAATLVIQCCRRREVVKQTSNDISLLPYGGVVIETCVDRRTYLHINPVNGYVQQRLTVGSRY